MILFNIRYVVGREVTTFFIRCQRQLDQQLHRVMLETLEHVG